MHPHTKLSIAYMQAYFYPPIFPLAPWESCLVVLVKANHSKRYLFTSTAPQLWAAIYKLPQKQLAERCTRKPGVGLVSTTCRALIICCRSVAVADTTRCPFPTARSSPSAPRLSGEPAVPSHMSRGHRSFPVGICIAPQPGMTMAAGLFRC